MRLLLVHNEYRRAEPSGENQVVHNEAVGLSSRGHDVIVWRQRSDDIADFTTVQKLTLPGRVVWSRTAARELARVIADHRPDLVHVHNTFPLISGSILGVLRERGIPGVATAHNYRLICAGGTLFREGHPCHDCLPSSHFPGVRHGCYRDSRLATAPVAVANALHRRSWQGLDAVLVLSAAQRRLFVEAGFDPARVWVKPNFVPDALTGSPLSTPGDTFVYAGRLAQAKGVGVLMKAWALLASRGIEPPLSILGRGPLDDEVMRFARMHRSVRVMGRVSPAECREHIRRARAVLAPSTWEETFGLVVVEAMMLGRCAVATAIGSFPDLVGHDGDGLLVPPDDAEALADAVARLHNSEDIAQRLGAAARATYEQRFRPEPNLELLETIYESVLRRAYV